MGKLLQMHLFADEPATAPIRDPEPLLPNQAFPDQAFPDQAFPDQALPDQATYNPSDPSVQELPDTAPDATQRQRALDIRRSCIVEAPAGSGKTGLLIQRFLKLLAYGEVDRPDQVLAVTFTRKADAEMRRRVLKQLTAAQAGEVLKPDATPFDRTTRQLAREVLARDRALGWHLLDNPQQLNIRTIDSLCAEIAGSLPLQAGAAGRFTPTDDPGPLYAAAAERTLLHLGGPDPVLTEDLSNLLRRRDVQPGAVRQLLAGMLRHRAQWAELLPLRHEKLTEAALDAEVRPRLTHTLRRLLGNELETLAETLGQDMLERLATTAHRLAIELGSTLLEPLAPCAECQNAPGTRGDDLPHWVALSHLVLVDRGSWRKRIAANTFGGPLSPILREEVGTLIADLQVRESFCPGLADALCQLRNLPEPEYSEDDWAIVKALCRVLQQALLELQVLFAERRTCDFDEVAISARALLRSDAAAPELLNSSLGNLRHLLVDEMQDTSAGQYELFESLTQSWDGATQTIFLVGDPKQSIYEFRLARVERFNNVMESGRFGNIAITPLRLTANFRSQGALVQAFNDTFTHILPPLGDASLGAGSVDVPFIAAEATRPSTLQPALHWHPQLAGENASAPADQPDEASAPGHAQAIRRTVEAFLQAWPHDGKLPPRPARVAILARNRVHLAPVLKELRQDYGTGPLPFRAVDVEALEERPEILDLLALTRALLDTADRIAWLSVLRSPVCGLTLQDLLLLVGDGPDADLHATLPYLVATRGQLLSPNGRLLLDRAWRVLGPALAENGRTPLSVHVDRVWRSLGGDITLQPHERANTDRYFSLLAALETGPEPFNLALLKRRLETLYAAPGYPEAQVELMTIHKAKGLEWDLVLVPELQRLSGTNQHEFLRWLEFSEPGGNPGLLVAPLSSKGEKNSRLYDWLGRKQRARELAETKRLFYVASTRASEALHLYGTATRNKGGELTAPKPGTILCAAWPAAEAAFRALADAPVPDAESRVVPFPSVIPPAQSLSLAASSADPEPPPERAGAAPAPDSRPRRLPLSFDSLQRLAHLQGAGLPYPAARSLPSERAFLRPEGSFSARAFGNAAHRFLALLSTRLGEGQPLPELRAELPRWGSRLVTILRAEGLSSPDSTREAARLAAALQSTLADADGAWLLSPHLGARNEAPIPSAQSNAGLRADRTFFAGPGPHAPGDDHLWIVDYKTTELGGLARDNFLATQRAKYMPQMQTYADAAVSGGHDPACIMLALYFPLLPAFVCWPAAAFRP